MIERGDSLIDRSDRAPRMRLVRQAVASLALLAGCLPGSTGPALADVVDPARENPIAAFQDQEARLFAIGYRLAAANAPYCSRRTPTIGLLAHDAQAYAQSDAVRSLLGLSGDIGVQAVAEGSPAAAAGLRQNDTLIAIDAEPTRDLSFSEERRWERAALINRWLASTDPIELEWRGRAGDVSSATIVPTLACASAFELTSGNSKAYADGSRVLVGADFPGFAYPDDEFAAAIAHEMAHNVLGHIDFLDKEKRKRSLVRLSERDADRLMPWLLANAGYDPRAAVRFMQRFGPRHGGGLLRKRTHDGWDERVEFIEAEVLAIDVLRSSNPAAFADWSKDFAPLLAIPPSED